MDSQCEAVLAYMKDNPEGITQLDALNELGCMRLASRISDLRGMGHRIKTKTVKTKNRFGQSVRFACYVLEGE